jgi:glycerophosphoryl diester phosphodiesterase
MTWVANLVCVVWTWFKKMVCVSWVFVSVPICLIPVIGPAIVGFVDFMIGVGLALAGALISGPIAFASHPFQSLETFISYFRGCPKDRAAKIGPLQIIAHHGSVDYYPENTVQSFAHAVIRGANALELDVCLTKDHQVVLWHDWDPDDVISISRQTEIGGNGAFKPDVPPVGSVWRKSTIDLTLDEFRQHFTYKDTRDSPDLAAEKVIPTLNEFASALAGAGTFLGAAVNWQQIKTIYIDVKMPATAAHMYGGLLTDQIYAMINGNPAPTFNTVVMVPDSIVLQVMKSRSLLMGYNLKFTWDVEFPFGIILNPTIYSAIDHATNTLFHNSVASVGRPVSLLAWANYRRTISYDIKQWNLVNGNVASKNAGVNIDSLISWTINKHDEMKCLSSMGVTGIITDKIETLVNAAFETGR